MDWRILCYHEIPSDCAGTFAAHLAFLRQRGWSFCTVGEGVRMLSENSQGKWITITFDDGDATLHGVAQDVLARHAVRSCAYVTTDYIAKGGRYRDRPPRECMSWEQLADWKAAGHEVGSHTHTHPLLAYCHPARLRQELVLSQDILQQHLSCPVRHLSYPHGHFTGALQQRIAAAAIYDSCASIDRGTMRRLTLPLRRDVVEPWWSARRLEWMLRWGNSPAYALHRRLRQVPLSAAAGDREAL